MGQIFGDFRDSLVMIGKCCSLKDVTYLGGNIPDYSKPEIQQLYLLKYFPAYLIEYYNIYSKIIKLDFLSTPFNILSIGTGCGVDYCGLEFALRDSEMNSADYAYYTGIDRITWNYREYFGNKDCLYLDKDITEWNKLDKNNYSIIMFPKSIGELNGNDFQKILDIFNNSKFQCNKMIIASSVRELSDEIDVHRLSNLIDIFIKEHGYTCLDKKATYTHFKEDVGLRKIFSDFVYPQDILDFLANLLEQCEGYRLNEQNSCEAECESILNRWPILKTGHIKFQIKRLEKA